MKTAQIYTYTVTANGSVQILVEGSLFKIIASTGPVSVTGDFGTLGPILAGQGMKGQNSKRFNVNDMSGAINIVRILIADESFIDDRVSGEVSIIDGEKSRTLAGGMYAGGVYCNGAAGQYANAQLWNPPGSGKNLIVGAVSYGTNGGSAINVIGTSVQCANAGQYPIANKKIGYGGVVALLRQESKAAVDPFTNGCLRNENTAATVPQQWQIKGAIVVPPGTGLTVYGPLAASTVTANFEWFEDPI